MILRILLFVLTLLYPVYLTVNLPYKSPTLSAIMFLIIIAAYWYESRKKQRAILEDGKRQKMLFELQCRNELGLKGHSVEYIDQLGESPLFKEYYKRARELEDAHKAKEALTEYIRCLNIPDVLDIEKIPVIVGIGNCKFIIDPIRNLKFAFCQYTKARKIAKKVHDPEGIFLTYYNCGHIHYYVANRRHKKGHNKKAIKFLKKAFKHSKNLRSAAHDSLSLLAQNYSDIFLITKNRKYLDKAAAVLEKALGYDTDNQDLKALNYVFLGNAYYFKCKYLEAASYFMEANKICDSHQGDGKYERVLDLLTDAYNRMKKAIGYPEQGS